MISEAGWPLRQKSAALGARLRRENRRRPLARLGDADAADGEPQWRLAKPPQFSVRS
jgi:hypothetical protein